MIFMLNAEKMHGKDAEAAAGRGPFSARKMGMRSHACIAHGQALSYADW
jgi:hypothetical protein